MSTGIGVLTYQQLWLGTAFRQELAASDWEHELGANGGCLNARCSLVVPRLLAEEWLADGLGRHVIVVDSGGLLWSGFVNQVAVDLGFVTLTRGPLNQIANRVTGVYALTNQAGSSSTRLFTLAFEDATSQARWGIWDRIISLGTLATVEEAEGNVRAYLAATAEPAVNETLLLDQAHSGARVTLELLGYGAWLGAYPYVLLPEHDATKNTEIYTLTSVSAKIAAILAQDPNHLISVPAGALAANDTLVAAEEYDVPVAETLLTSLGDKLVGATYSRALIGVNAAREFTYQLVPTTVAYRQRLLAARGEWTTADGAEIWPWRLAAGQWLQLSDLLLGPLGYTPATGDVRQLFIERVKFRMPRQIEIETSRVNTLTARLKALGIMGVN